MRFPTSTYDLIRSAIPGPPLKQNRAVATIVLLQAQRQYTNLSDQYQVWKLPGSRQEPGKVVILFSFHESIAESLTTVVQFLAPSHERDYLPSAVTLGETPSRARRMAG